MSIFVISCLHSQCQIEANFSLLLCESWTREPTTSTLLYTVQHIATHCTPPGPQEKQEICSQWTCWMPCSWSPSWTLYNLWAVKGELLVLSVLESKCILWIINWFGKKLTIGCSLSMSGSVVPSTVNLPQLWCAVLSTSRTVFFKSAPSLTKIFWASLLSWNSFRKAR